MQQHRSPAPDRFDRETTADILDLATAFEAAGRGHDLDLSRRELYRVADELDISPEAVDVAIAQLSRRAADSAKANRKAAKRRMRFVRHVIAFAVVVTMLALVDAIAGDGWWFFYVAGLWGILIVLHASRFLTRRNGPLERRMLAGDEPSAGVS